MSLDKSFQLHFSAPVTPKTLARYGEIERAEGLEAELRVSRAKAAAVAQSILAKLPVADISIQDTPIEAIVGQLMTKDRIKP
jgi:ABC-2 type transport system ATP-binding protein